MAAFLPLLTLFLLRVFGGLEIITKVPPLRHPPLLEANGSSTQQP